jgi:predicted ATPase/DNA-binding SARP family transcriptional activator
MMQSTIKLFGGLLIEQDSQPIPKLISRKTDILLAYLAQEQRPHSREILATLLWDNRSQKQALSNLRTLIASLRKQAEAFVTIDRKILAINEAVQVDTAVFSQQLLTAQTIWPSPAAVEQIEQALSLYIGDFLEGVQAGDSLELENWIQFSREQLRQQAIDARQQLISFYLQQSRYTDGIRHATIVLEMDPWHEETHRQMMQLLARNGQRQAALTQYETCVALLDEELGIPPEPETTQLYERIQTAVITPSSSLPAISTSFVGRENELDLCLTHLRNPACRLLTLIGLGGMGKTRLALQTASAMQMDFLNGVYFVPLAAVESPDAVLTAVAEAIEAPFAAANVQTHLQNYLRGKEMLLILDNFEQLLPAAPVLATLLQHAPALKLLVTSRIRLDIRAEWLLELSGLSYPNGDVTNNNTYAAVQLFDQRARVIAPEFKLSDDNLPSIKRICQIVQGMPLGIELTAAWIRALSPAQIAQQIEENLDLLATTARDVPERQRSVTAVFDSVWSLLSEDEQRVFAQLSVFHGDFDLTAFLKITGASPWAVAALVEKSLLQKEDDAHNSARYRLVELLRLYSSDKLAPHAEDEKAVRQRHSEYYLTFLQEQQAQLTGRQQHRAMQAIGWERENIRAAWMWAVSQTNMNQIVRSAEGIQQFYQRRGPYLEGIQIIQAALDKLEGQAEEPYAPDQKTAIATLYLAQSRLWHEAGQFNTARAAIDSAKAILANVSARDIMANLHLEQGRNDWRQSAHETAVQHTESALTLSREIGLREVETRALSTLGAIAVQQADYQQAEARYKEALVIARQLGDRFNEAKLINNLGVCYTETGDFVQAQQFHQRSLEIKLEIGDRRGERAAISNLGILALGREEFPQAQAYFEQCRQIEKSLGDRRSESMSLMNLARVQAYLGNYEQAKVYLAQALAMAQEVASPMAENQVIIVSAIIFGQAEAHKDAHAYAIQALDMAKTHRYRSIMAHANYWIGQSLLGMGRVGEAVEKFIEALVLRQTLGENNLMAEAHAGLAGALLAQGNKFAALEQIDSVLAHLQTGSLAGTDEPARIRLTICEVLMANEDERASIFLQEFVSLIHAQAAVIDSAEQRKIFLEDVPAHAKICHLYEGYQASGFTKKSDA